ncbi:OmpA family protein [Plastoroseomonas hellenica]|uniref:OmpA family protein n=1 Tax=Plastoroseomonas hellenica TaxID=2687306 RepID=UPI001BA73389|nr:OmpA family protein [Plastoroseomonas hellenica]MBR0645935.1 OmpA family protein [Plastoroseomonas hellenica]
MTFRLLLASATALTLALPMIPASVLAQSDPAALDLIQRLRPQSGQTRGIRVPGAAAETPTAPQPVQPAPVYSTPGQSNSSSSSSSAPRPQGGAVAGPGAPMARPLPPRETTAVDGQAAANITVTFPSGSATLTPEAERQLAPLGRALASTELSAYRFRIEGHTDTVGSAELNQALSERRAAAVRDFLVRRFGVNPTRLEAVGLGQTQLLVSTPDNTPMPRNRRVQVVNIGG